ncbi:MAG: hypothetical protein IH628_03705 [Proteobacteria bacterium]|nr:hypothetical protein [Pseudomonadota bacterium]
MSDGYNFENLKREILSRSHAQDWEVAKREWHLVEISEADEPETCLCGHTPIIELCTIHNKATNTHVDVGNVCVKRFLGFRSDLIFSSIRRIRRDVTKSIGSDAIAFFFTSRVINNWEYDFLQDTFRKRNLSERQLAARRNINEKILFYVKRRGVR